MKVIIGLGNPGDKYVNTRHNVGFMFLDKLVEVSGVDKVWEKKRGIMICLIGELVLVKSDEYFMNESGKIIQDLEYLGISGELIVVHDDLDIKLGEYKIQDAKGPELHGGLNDIDRKFGKNYSRIRIGVDNRDKENRIPGDMYVLQNFLPEEIDRLKSVIDEIAKRYIG